jgi:hypothetical protein
MSTLGSSTSTVEWGYEPTRQFVPASTAGGKLGIRRCDRRCRWHYWADRATGTHGAIHSPLCDNPACPEPDSNRIDVHEKANKEEWGYEPTLEEEAPKRIRSCRLCREVGHNRTTCLRKLATDPELGPKWEHEEHDAFEKELQRRLELKKTLDESHGKRRKTGRAPRLSANVGEAKNHPLLAHYIASANRRSVRGQANPCLPFGGQAANAANAAKAPNAMNQQQRGK